MAVEKNWETLGESYDVKRAIDFKKISKSLLFLLPLHVFYLWEVNKY